jgi:hypothetical protein
LAWIRQIFGMCGHFEKMFGGQIFVVAFLDLWGQEKPKKLYLEILSHVSSQSQSRIKLNRVQKFLFINWRFLAPEKQKKIKCW